MKNEDIKRFLGKFLDTKSCWVWGSCNTYGYGMFDLCCKRVRAHRLSYELFFGKKIPEGLQIDHLCKNRACVNPCHLELVSAKENIRRGFKSPDIALRPTHCINGHPFSLENTSSVKNKRNRAWRRCKICHNARMVKWREANPIKAEIQKLKQKQYRARMRERWNEMNRQ